MRAVKVVEGLKGLLGVRRNEEILPAVEGLLAQVEALKGRRAPRPPIGVVLLMDEEGDGPFSAWPVGMVGGDLLRKTMRVREAGRRFIEGELTATIDQLRAAAVEEQVRRELGTRNADGETADGENGRMKMEQGM